MLFWDYRMYNGIEDSMVVQGPLYLIKIKENGKYGARDLLWAIGQKMEEPLNFGGMKSLVEGINKKGLFTPKLVEQGASKTWGEVKGQVQLQAFEIVGSPTTLLRMFIPSTGS